MKFDLSNIKHILEKEYDVYFKYSTYVDEKSLHAMTKTNGEIDIYITTYDTTDERNGTEFIAFSFESNNSNSWGFSNPCDNVNELFACMDKIAKRNVQLSLF